MFYNCRIMDVIILRNHLVLIYFWYYLEWILYFSICFLSFSFKNNLCKVWWRCGEDVVIKIFRLFIRKRLTQGLVKMWWRCGEDVVIKIFRPFICKIYFARDLRKIFRKSVEKYFDHSYARDLRKRLTQGLVKMWWRCGDKDISTIHTPDIFRKISEDVVKVCWRFYVSKLFICSYCSISLLIIAFMLRIFLFEMVSVISL